MADKFGGQKDGRQTTGATFYDVPAVPVNANALYFPNFPASPFFGVAEYPVAAGDLGAFSTSGVFVFDKPAGWIDNAGRKVFYRPKTAATGEIVAQEIKGDVFIGLQIVDNINPQKLGVLLASPEFCMNVLMVTSTADSGAGSLRQAIADAQDGDVILFDADVFPAGQTTSILLSSYITINKSISIYGGESDGEGGYTSGATKRFYVYREIEDVKTKTYITGDNPAQEGETVLFENVCRIVLDEQEQHRHLSLSRTFTCSGVAFINGYSGGGAVYIPSASETRFTDCHFEHNATSTSGAAFNISSGVNDIVNCSFVDCSSVSSGGVFVIGGASQNTIVDCCFYNCNAANGGVFHALSSSKNNINNCIIEGFTVSANGACVYASGSSINTLEDCKINNGSANIGGALYVRDTTNTTLTGCEITNCSATNNGGGVWSGSASQITLNDCKFDSCSAMNGGAVYTSSDSRSTLNDCVITNCSATNNGGGLYSYGTSQNTLNDCNISGCSATNGGGLYSTSASQNTLNDCNVSGCSANYCGGLYSYGTSQNTLNDCTISGNSSDLDATRRDAVIGETSVAIINGSNFGALRINVNAQVTVQSGITTVDTLTLLTSSGVYPTITIADGAALTITDTATIGAATFTSEGRGYLAVAAGIDVSAATLDGVVLCAYGAGLESFDISADGASWTAQDLTVPILIETRDAGGDWQTLTDAATGGAYATTFALESTARAFDGVAFFVATLSGYWQADAGAVDSNDWSVRGFAAANSNGGGDAQGDAAQGWTVATSTVTPNADGV